MNITSLGLVPLPSLPGNSPPEYLSKYYNSLFECVENFDKDDKAKNIALAEHYLRSALISVGVFHPIERCSMAVRRIFQELLADGESISSHIPVEQDDLLFCPAYWHDIPPKYYKNIKRMGANIVTLVHDILPIAYSKFYEAPWKFDFERNLKEALKYADSICTVSEYTAKSILEFSARRSIELKDVRVVYNGFDELLSGRVQDHINEEEFTAVLGKHEELEFIKLHNPYLMVGTLEPKKGHIPTIKSFEAMWRAGLERPLVVVGRKGWMEKNVVSCIEDSDYFGSKLFWFDYFDDLDLYLSYKYSRALIFSSYAEGFGIPMIEALSAGRPVVSYATDISREILGNYGLFFTDLAELVEVIYDLEQEESYSRVCSKLKDFSWPSWKNVVTDLFNSFAGKPNLHLA